MCVQESSGRAAPSPTSSQTTHSWTTLCGPSQTQSSTPSNTRWSSALRLLPLPQDARWVSCARSLYLSFIQDALHQLARHQQTIIFRLRTGHCRLNSHLKRIGVKTSAQGPRGEANQTPEHYLQSCSLHQQTRQQIWPTCESLKTKLWGSAEDLFLTSRYAALTGERI